MRTWILGILIVATTPVLLSAQNETETETETINWISFEEAVERNKTEARKFFIDFYTSWCPSL